MREKLLELLNREGLRPSQLADMLEINPAGISHILAGRNKPSFELLQKILRRFPRINPDWLLLDSDQMYRSDISHETPVNSVNASLASGRTPANRNIGNDLGLFADSSKNENHASTSTIGPNSEAATVDSASDIRVSAPHKAAVKRIVIFYDDQTFETFTPTSK